MKKILSFVLCLLMMLSLFSGCARGMDLFIQEEYEEDGKKTSSYTNETLPPKQTQTPVENTKPTQPTEPTEPTEPKVPTYSAGEYTTSGYSSQWLDLSYNTHWTMAVSEYDIQINKNYTKGQLEQDPYAEAIEMQYFWAGTENSAVTIYVTALKNPNTSVNSLADAQWDSARSFYIDLRSYGYSTSFDCDENKTITYLGQEYVLQHFRVVSDNGRNETSDTEQWNLYRIIDNYLIRINFTADYQSWTLDDFLSLFTSYDGSKTHKSTVSISTIAPYEVTPYLLDILEATHPIYSEPSYSSDYVGTVQYAGYYTIVAEAWDNAGNIWGKLKSGAGWIDISMYDRPSQKPQSNATSGTTDKGLFNALGYSKVWAADYYFGGYFYHIYLVFERDGTCYFALCDVQLWAAGKGTYSVTDYTLNINITAGGNKLSGTYRFEPDTNALVVTSQEGLVGQRGDIFTLYRDTGIDVDKVIKWGNDYAYNSISWDW